MQFKICRLLILLILSVMPPTAAYAQERLTQRRINEFAAALEQARFVLVEGTGLRRKGEPLQPYLHRISQPLPSETLTAYLTRISRYVDALAAAADATAPLRHSPPLSDGSMENQAVWRRSMRALSLLPARIRKLRTAWRTIRTLIVHPSAASRSNVPAPPQMDVELTRTLELELSAFSALRDALP